MILACNLQLGLRDQTVIGIDNDGNTVSMIHVEMENLPDTICGVYYAYNYQEVFLNGPEKMCHKVADDIKDMSATLYADREPIKINIVERG